ncbi:Longin-like domain-containing protein [Aspergillus karnatakaensis]|uniref:TRAPP subunit BET5 n=1 Tax=Aspergillus karnatakaensis TaxID=1810916 RepID=UPI003CCE40B3
MTVYSFYIFDRHAECIYKRRWLPRPPSIAGKSRPTSDTPTLANGLAPAADQSTRTTDDDAKLIFGTVFSLRNMVRKLGGEDDNFVTYSTSQYKLHYYETPTNIKFVMLTDTKSPNMRVALQQIYINLYVEYVVKNPLSPVEHPGGVGVNNELFEQSLEQFVVCDLLNVVPSWPNVRRHEFLPKGIHKAIISITALSHVLNSSATEPSGENTSRNLAQEKRFKMSAPKIERYDRTVARVRIMAVAARMGSRKQASGLEISADILELGGRTNMYSEQKGET